MASCEDSDRLVAITRAASSKGDTFVASAQGDFLLFGNPDWKHEPRLPNGGSRTEVRWPGLPVEPGNSFSTVDASFMIVCSLSVALLAYKMPRLLSHIPREEARAAILSLLAGAALLTLKFVAFYLTNSAAVFSDAMESIVNVVAAAMALYALHLAHQPADVDHPYGHGKVEFLSGALEGGMIVMAAVVTALNAVVQLAREASLPAKHAATATLLITTAMLVNGLLGFVLIRVGRRVSSPALQADGQHLLGDAVTSVGALVGLVGVSLTRRPWVDPVAALAVATYIGWIGIRLLRQSVGGLMDRQDLADEMLLRGILNAHVGGNATAPAICSYHKLRHRHSGRYHWVDFHIMVPPVLDVRRGHEIASSIEYEIELALGEANATAHIEPCDDPACGCSTSLPETAAAAQSTPL